MAEKGHIAHFTFGDIIGDSPPFTKIIKLAKKFAEVDSTILIEGESGTGKEVFAQAIHSASRRRKGPFVAVNCGAIPDSILESGLFGYQAGAFTGARRQEKTACSPRRTRVQYFSMKSVKHRRIFKQPC
jgi:transcriptional regulator with PAS, ATPase and Fis domain